MRTEKIVSDPNPAQTRVEPTRSQALRSTSLIGAASVISVLFGLVRTKLAAVLLGPSGIGLIGLLQSIVASASTIYGCGTTNSGTRQVAQALQSPQKLATLRAALFFGTLFLAALGGVSIWLFRDLISLQILGNADYSAEFSWLAVAVALTIGTGSQTAVIRGMQRPRDVALIMIIGAAIGAALGVGFLLAFGANGIFLFVAAGPLASFIVGHWYVAKLPKPARHGHPMAVVHEWGTVFRLGLVLMVAGVGVVLGHLWLRTEVARGFGPVNLGYFQAVWMISATYLGFVLTALGNEYFPRVAANIHNQSTLVQMINHQTEIVLLIGVPILLATYLFSSVMLYLLFSSDFIPAKDLLRLFVIGDLIKLIAFPLRYVVMSSGKGWVFVVSELLPIGLIIATVMLLGDDIGLAAAGWGYLLMQFATLCISLLFVIKSHGFFWDHASLRIIVIGLSSLGLATLIASHLDDAGLYVVSGAVLLAVLIISIRRLMAIHANSGAELSSKAVAAVGKIGARLIKPRNQRAV